MLVSDIQQNNSICFNKYSLNRQVKKKKKSWRKGFGRRPEESIIELK